jgi:hypothetical protein
MSTTAKLLTPRQVRQAGLDALFRELGPAGMAEFLLQFESARGDYSKERHRWLDGQDVDTLVRKIQRRRRKSAGPR